MEVHPQIFKDLESLDTWQFGETRYVISHQIVHSYTISSFHIISLQYSIKLQTSFTDWRWRRKIAKLQWSINCTNSRSISLAPRSWWTGWAVELVFVKSLAIGVTQNIKTNSDVHILCIFELLFASKTHLFFLFILMHSSYLDVSRYASPREQITVRRRPNILVNWNLY